MGNIRRALRDAEDTSPGRDGLPYAAWFNAGEHGVKTLSLVSDRLRNKKPMPVDFNDGDHVFLPKCDDDEFDGGFACFATDTRPICKKNTDNKTVSSANNACILPALE
eukprot:9864256-Karenia_brevis.AAC.1